MQDMAVLDDLALAAFLGILAGNLRGVEHDGGVAVLIDAHNGNEVAAVREQAHPAVLGTVAADVCDAHVAGKEQRAHKLLVHGHDQVEVEALGQVRGKLAHVGARAVVGAHRHRELQGICQREHLAGEVGDGHAGRAHAAAGIADRGRGVVQLRATRVGGVQHVRVVLLVHVVHWFNPFFRQHIACHHT